MVTTLRSGSSTTDGPARGQGGFDSTSHARAFCARSCFSTVFYLELWKLLDRKWPLQVARQSAAKAMTSSVVGGSLMAAVLLWLSVRQQYISMSAPAGFGRGAEVSTCEGSAQLLPLHRVGIEAVQKGPAMQIGGGFWFVCNFCNFQFAPPSMRILIMVDSLCSGTHCCP